MKIKIVKKNPLLREIEHFKKELDNLEHHLSNIDTILRQSEEVEEE